MTSLVHRGLERLRDIDTRLSRQSSRRRILVDGHTPMNFVMVAPVVRAMERDGRIEFYFTSSTNPERIDEIYRAAGPVRTIHPWRAALMKFDAYVASDFIWAPLLRGTERVQVFHGVAGKYGFDAPTESMRQWDRLFFVNERRLRNVVAAGAIDAGSPAIRLVGMPKVDCLVDGTLSRDEVLARVGLDPTRPTVLYAPTWSPASSLNVLGLDLVKRLCALPVNVLVKLHDRSRDRRERYSGGVDWVARLSPVLADGRCVLAPGHDLSPYLVAADLMITDHSSAGFEFLLRDRPLVRIHLPRLVELAQIHPDYVDLLASVSRSVHDAAGAVEAVEAALADPGAQSDERRRVASELFYRPGTATARSVSALYEVIDLDAAPTVTRVQEGTWQPSA